MTKIEFTKESDLILQKWGVVDGVIDTPFGLLRVRVEKANNIKLYSLFMQFTQDFDIEMFYRYFSKHENINRFSKKWNLHTSNFEYLLGELDERLDNLNHILALDGKIQVVDYKPFLELIETK